MPREFIPESNKAPYAVRTLLLNPPGSRPYLRDYYCAGIAKSRYSYPPMDLVYLSGRVAPLGECRFLDAIAGRIPGEEARRQVAEWDPQVIISLISGPSLNEDMDFLESVHRPGRRILASGDILRDLGTAVLEAYPFLDGALLDFTEPAVADWLRGTAGPPLPGLILRDRSGRPVPGPPPAHRGEFSMPSPCWECIPLDIYRFPFTRRRRFASVLTDFGCPFTCAFCPMGTIPWKTRPLSEIELELQSLRDRGIREIHFRDQTFGLPPERLARLLDVLEPMNFSWSCFSRVDVLNESALRRMRRAGCHTIIFGIESAGEARRRSFHKNTPDSAVWTTLRHCRRCGIRTVGTFILGLPGDSLRSVRATVRYACSLPLDYASFNVAMPRFGTELRQAGPETSGAREALAAAVGDRQGFAPLAEAQAWVRYANRRFYLDPRVILRQLAGLRSPQELARKLRMGLSLLVGER